MRLTKIKLAGFKSFVDPTSIPFPDDMTAIVGPNGCGKSNVIDAVRWVLGESSAKNLRGDAMTDVIFNGSTARKPVSQCTVELVFDNSAGRIKGEYAAYQELSVKRTVSRDGQSGYLLNHAKCRRRDVTDLFLGTGLGPRSYAIIEQGTISRLIESKPQELRVFIEEAAGISKYKERRRETETRIRHTKENLERLADVRGELGQQLQKLERQAVAARKYKTLKQQEREYKAQLAALRWRKHSEKIAALEKDAAVQQADIDAYVAQQRGDEKNIVLRREQQQDLKQQLQDIQQRYFSLGTDITRLEQNQIHSKQRRQQIEQELSDLQRGIADSEQRAKQTAQQLHLLSEKQVSSEPELDIVEQTLHQAQDDLQISEESFAQQQNQWRTQDQAFNQHQQQAQSCDSKIQSIMDLQVRTQHRIGELSQELKELQDNVLEQEIQQAKDAVASQKRQLAIEQSQLQGAQLAHQQLISKLRDFEQAGLRKQGKTQELTARCSALKSIQQLSSQSAQLQEQLEQQNLSAQSWWQTLKVKPGWEPAFETVTMGWQQAMLLHSRPDIEQTRGIKGATLLFAQQMTDSYAANSLASKIDNKHVPGWLSCILVADSLAVAQQMLASLQPWQSVITPDGIWLAQDWLITGCQEQDGGLLQRAKLIEQLEEQIQVADEDHQQHIKQLSALQERGNVLEGDWQQAREALSTCQQTLGQQQNQCDFLQQQQAQTTQRQQKLRLELDQQQDRLADECQQLEVLTKQAQELEKQLASLGDQQLDVDTLRDKLEQNIRTKRNQVESGKNQRHQLALQIQAVQSQQESLLSAGQRDVTILKDMQQKSAGLHAELSQILEPLSDQTQMLQTLLEQRLATELEQQRLSVLLGQADDYLAGVAKGQQGVNAKIQQMQQGLQSINIEAEGFRVRAKGILEQLQEMQQLLKPVLEAMPGNARESLWQEHVEQTAAALDRLGAVNLAAVEEYDVQAQRKKHLDEQHEDLTSALEILEQAIRKIDKETRTRFKTTFEQVNQGLQNLFPKVFGGGSAYLDLTDTDLLETGVTIMARPPGKKNSTIQLLSGGEKALTALSLVFAIFALNPAPFCLLDEVDAPLDDTNVGRFCKLVSEMSKNVQFIYITHNKIAMEMATHLTGVTMAEPGVSRMVAVDVDEALAIAQV
ncbi:MAG: chromosome segregation protein [Paraglaciecola sp.]|jgi:chromosome segregation protein